MINFLLEIYLKLAYRLRLQLSAVTRDLLSVVRSFRLSGLSSFTSDVKCVIDFADSTDASYSDNVQTKGIPKRRTFLVVIGVCLGLVLALVYCLGINGESQVDRWHRLATFQISEGEFTKAVVNLDRIVESNSESGEQVYSDLLHAIQELGHADRVNELLTKIAPESGQPGFGFGHRWRAIELASKIRRGEDQQLKRLNWHLRNCDDVASAEINLAWARYSVALGDGDNATEYYRLASHGDPVYWLHVIELHRTLGKSMQLNYALESGEKAITDKLKSNPSDERLRLALAELYFKSNRFDECESVLKVGVEKYPTTSTLKSLARFVASKYGRMNSTTPYDEKTQVVFESLKLDPQNERTQQAVEHLYVNAESNDEKRVVLNMLSSLIDSERPANHGAIEEFLLGKLLANDGFLVKASPLAEIAWQKNPDDPKRSHLMAWLLLNQLVGNSNSDELDDNTLSNLTRATELAQHSVSSDPGRVDYRLTLGAAQFARKQFKAASLSLESSLTVAKTVPSMRQKKQIHQLLSQCYRELGMMDLADAYAKSF